MAGPSARLDRVPIFGEHCIVGRVVERVAEFESCQLREIRKRTPVISDAMSTGVRTSKTPNGEDEPVEQHDFTLLLAHDPSEEEADTLYGVIDDGTISTIGGVPQIHFHRNAATLEEAIRSAIGDVKSAGFDVVRVELEPNAFLPTT